ncbi:hypothetical protein HKX48_008243 [Thoreauomyces humboldtii]|nr:hypothetical protein HKX48_008243 [Thoreauomyces humboldtii]
MAKYIAEGKMDDPDVQYRLEDARDFLGECEDMCPEYERHEREYQKGLMEFEKLPDTERVDHQKAVKRYRRSAADDEKPLPCDVRPPRVLERTLDYLVHEVLPTYGIQRTYGFLRDRMRAIRKDITLQNLRGPEAVSLFERIARYHLMCSQKLCETIDIKQEYEQLGKTLQSLMEFYDDLREDGRNMPNEAEFRAYYLLHHAFNPDVQSSLEHKFRRDSILSDPLIQTAVKLRSLLPRLDLHHEDEDDNYSDAIETVGEGGFDAYSVFFRCIENPTTPYLLACAAHPHFLVVRRYAYRHMMGAFYVFPNALDTMTSVPDLVGRLGYDNEEDVTIDLEYYDIQMTAHESTWYAMIGKLKSTTPDGKSTMIPGNFNGGSEIAQQAADAEELRAATARQVEAEQRALEEEKRRLEQARIQETLAAQEAERQQMQKLEAQSLRESQMRLAQESERKKQELEAARIRAEEAQQQSRIVDDALSGIAGELMKEVTGRLFKEALENELYRKEARSRWRRFAKKLPKLHAVEHAKRQAVQTFLDLAGSEIASPNVSYKTRVNSLLGSASRSLTFSMNANRDAELAKASDEIAMKEQAAMAQLQVARLVHSAVRKSSAISVKTVYYKLCLCTPPFQLRSSNKKRHCIQWLKAKFGGPANSMPTLNGTGDYEELQRTHDVIRSDGTSLDCWAIVQHIPPLDAPLQGLAAQKIFGLNTLIFQFDLFEAHTDLGFYFNNERNRFVHLMNSLPSRLVHSKIPILFIYWSVPSMTLAVVKSRVRKLFALDFVQKAGPLSSVHWLDLAQNEDVTSLQKASDDLESLLADLAQKASSTPEMSFLGAPGNDILGERLFTTHYKEHLDQLQSRFPHRMAFNLEHNIFTFNTIIQLYNETISVMNTTLSGPDVVGTNFPPWEFALERANEEGNPIEGVTAVSLSWNDEARMQTLRAHIAAATIPSLDHTSTNMSEHPKHFAQQLIASLRPLWTAYASWLETICKHFSSDTPARLNELFQLFERTSHVPTFASRFPFGEIVDIVMRIALAPLDAALRREYQLAPYPKDIAVSALEQYDKKSIAAIDEWYEHHVLEWLDAEDVPEYQSEEEMEEDEQVDDEEEESRAGHSAANSVSGLDAEDYEDAWSWSTGPLSPYRRPDRKEVPSEDRFRKRHRPSGREGGLDAHSPSRSSEKRVRTDSSRRTTPDHEFRQDEESDDLTHVRDHRAAVGSDRASWTTALRDGPLASDARAVRDQYHRDQVTEDELLELEILDSLCEEEDDTLPQLTEEDLRELEELDAGSATHNYRHFHSSHGR